MKINFHWKYEKSICKSIIVFVINIFPNFYLSNTENLMKHFIIKLLPTYFIFLNYFVFNIKCYSLHSTHVYLNVESFFPPPPNKKHISI